MSVVGRAHEIASKVLQFALVSGCGLGLDFALFLLLLQLGLAPSYANFASATSAVTFVYFVSTRQIFEYKGQFLARLFLIYLVYQALAVTAASWAVGLLVDVTDAAPAIAKLAILPITFSANYLVLHALTAIKG